MTATITEILKNEVYPQIDAVREGFLDDLGPRKTGQAYTMTCPVCQKPKKAFYYPGSSHIVCNRKNNCGASVSLWDYLQDGMGYSQKEALELLADTAGIDLPGRNGGSDRSNKEKIKSALKYGLTKSNRAIEYLTLKRGWHEREIEAAPFGYIHNYEYFLGGYERIGGDPEFLKMCGLDQILTSGHRQMFESALVGWWEQPDGTLRLWARDITGNKKTKYYYQPNSARDIPCYLNEPVNKESRDHIILVEGVLDAARLMSNGIPAVAIGGAGVTDKQSVTIAKQISSYTHWIDEDLAGEKGAVSTIVKTGRFGIYSQVFRMRGKYQVKDADEALNVIGAEELVDLIESESVGGGVFLAKTIVSHIKREGQDLLSLYERARHILDDLKGYTHSEFIKEMGKLGVPLTSRKTDALRMLANLLDSGMDEKEASLLVQRRFGVKVFLDG